MTHLDLEALRAALVVLNHAITVSDAHKLSSEHSELLIATLRMGAALSLRRLASEALPELTARRARDAEVEALVEAAKDMRSGWGYIRATHGDLYGVGWDRAQDAVDAALAPFTGAKP